MIHVDDDRDGVQSAVLPRVRHLAPVLAVCAAAAFAIGAMGTGGVAAGQTGIVRHTFVQKSSSSAGQTVQPIYYPLNPRRPSGASPTTDLPEDVLRQFLEYYSAMRYDLAIESALRLVEMVPDRPLAHYNLACVFAKLRRGDEALQALNQAVDFGWRNVGHTLIDPDLRSLRQEPDFVELIARMRRLIYAEQLPPVPLRTDSVERIIADVEAAAPQLMRTHHVPGMVVALIDGGEVAWTTSFGVADASTDVPLKSEQVFRVDGVRDMLALIAAMQQEAAGRLRLAALLEHRRELLASGASERESRRGADGARGDDRRIRAAGSVRVADPARPDFAPRDRGDLADALGLFEAVIEASADEGFDEYCRRNILNPLRVESVLLRPSPEQSSGAAVGHSLFGTPAANPASKNDSAGALCSAADLARITASLMTPQINGDPGAPASPAPTCITAANVKCLGEQVRAAEVGLGLRVAVEQTRFGTRVHMLDQAGGVGCLVRAFPDTGRGVIILFNSETGAACAAAIAHRALGGN